MQLIDEGFKAWWKKYSALALFAIAMIDTAAAAAWTASPALQELVKGTPWMAPVVVAVSGLIAALGFVGRFIRQADAIINLPEPKA